MSFSFPARVYPIVDTLNDPRRSYVELAGAVLAAGAPFLQLRAKSESTGRFVETARQLKALADRHRARLIINDRADIAKLVDAAGVHLGQDDVPAAAARRLLGPDKIIGLSTHNVAQAEAAAREGIADYIGFGPIFPTRSKAHPDPVQGLDGLQRVRARVALPIVAIGGIASRTVGEVLAAGADAVAMISEIVRASDVEAQVRELLAIQPATRPPL
ncbi:MAG TPA: thiamine phosphate synthase [Candidatus Margulisiibacteriota bacterium]|nr:thiamine phosphate synthase [Candidatus Margulisiibacteriota bacterium]